MDGNASGMRMKMFKKSVEHDSVVYYISAHILDDGITDSRNMRNVLGMCLEIVSSGEKVAGNEGLEALEYRRKLGVGHRQIQ